MSQGQNIVNRFVSKGIFPYQFAFTLLIPFRNIFLSPKMLLKRLPLKEDSRVLEVGPGPGYFSSHVAKAIPQGTLILADIQQEMLKYARKRLTKKKITNVEYHLCNGIDFPFETNSIDVIFMVTVLGEVDKKEQYLNEFFRILRPNGILSISEQAGDPDKLSVEEVKTLVEPIGFVFDCLYGTEKNYTVTFRKL